jgi:hypothetical protein
MTGFHAALEGAWLRHSGIEMESGDVYETELVVRVPFDPGMARDEAGYAERRSRLNWTGAGCFGGCSCEVDMSSTRCPNFDMLCVLLGEAGLRLFRNAGPYPDPVYLESLGDHEQEEWAPSRWRMLARFVFPDGAARAWVASPEGDPTFNGRGPDTDMEDPAWKRRRLGCPSDAPRTAGELR